MLCLILLIFKGVIVNTEEEISMNETLSFVQNNLYLNLVL